MNGHIAIPGYEGLYSINENGDVFSHNTNRMLKLRPNSNGYLRADLYKNSVRNQVLVHRLVGMLFIPNPQNRNELNHINGDRTDNNVKNLEWSTRSENLLHSYQNGRVGPGLGKLGALHANAHAVKCLTNGKVYGSQREAARELNLCYKQINQALCGKQSTVKGYKFERA